MPKRLWAWTIIAAVVSGNCLAASAPWMDKAVSTLRKEKTIVEVMFSNGSSTSLWISMRNDGTRRDGFAEYACVILHQEGMPSKMFTVIHIWDAKAMARGAQVEMGRYECENRD